MLINNAFFKSCYTIWFGTHKKYDKIKTANDNILIKIEIYVLKYLLKKNEIFPFP